MNLEKTKALSSDILKLLKEIYTHQNPSTLEKDLLKEKLRGLYEAIDEESTEVFETISNVTSEHTGTLNGHPVTEETPVDESEEKTPFIKGAFSFMESTEEITESKLEDIDSKEENIFERHSDEPEEILQEYIPVINETPAEIPSEEPASETTQVVETYTRVETHLQPLPDDIQNGGFPDEDQQKFLDELFSFQEVKELSDKLSLSPIPDLTKAMGINDRLLTVNELFGGDYGFFEESFKKINSMTSFEEAKTYLVDQVVLRHDWTNPSKKERARQFIRFVRRRYIHT